MKIDIERCSDGSAQNRTENGVGTVASGTVSGGWSPLHGASAGISDPSYQSLVERDGWERRERTAFDDLHRAGGDGRNGKYHGRGSRVGDRWSGFWMWAAAFLGMALAYTEVYLGILYGGGPYVYLENGAGSCFAGKCYALFCVLASLGMGCMVQAGALADSLRYAASLPPLGTGIILAVLTAVVLFGGAKRIGWTASVLVPVSAGLYLLAGGIAVFSFYDQIPEVLGKIVGGAFGLADNAGQTDGSSILNFSGISGGMTGYGMAAAIRSGVSRGVFSNEAGLGSLAVLHGMGEGKGRLRQRQEAQKQGMWAIFEVFFDTIIGCSLTAFLLLCVFPHNLTGKIDSLGGSGAVAAALAARFGNAGGIVTAACMVLFAFATILAWFYIGD